MKKIVLFSCIFVCSSLSISMQKHGPNYVCIIMGPSCSGKSTTSHGVHNKLGGWVFVGLDEILEEKEVSEGENFNEKLYAMDYLAEGINAQLDQEKNVVVDTNMYEKKLIEKLKHNPKIFHVLVYAPLKVLLERDNKRTKNLKRSEIRARRCQDYVCSTFARFYGEGLPISLVPCDLLLDTATLSKQECVEKVLTTILS